MSRLQRVALSLGNGLAWLFLLITAITVYEVVARYGFDAPTFWVHETSIALAALAFIIGGAYCMAEDRHMRVSVLTDKFGPGGQRLSALLSAAVGVVYLGGLAYASWRMTERSLFKFAADGRWQPETSGSAWNPPIPPLIKLALLLGTLLFLALVIQGLIRALRGSR